VQPRVEHAPLRLGVCGERLEPLAQRPLRLARVLLERRDELVALPLERDAKLFQTLLDPRRGGIARVREPLRDDAFGLTAEALDREVELAGEPAGRLFAAGSRRLLELLLRILGVTCGRS